MLKRATTDLALQHETTMQRTENELNKTFFIHIPLGLFCLLIFLQMVLPGHLLLAENRIYSLAGEWNFAMDPEDHGIEGKWFEQNLEERIQLPGVLQSQGYGDLISTRTPWVLSLYDRFWYERDQYREYTKSGNVKVPFLCQPPRHYLGVAWYQKIIEIPEEWTGDRIMLFLERTRWTSRVWLDERPIGSCRSLVTPHEFDLGIMPAGKHRLTIRLDNRMLLPYRPDAHGVSDSLGSTWNGIVGRIELWASTPVWIDDAQVYPDVANRQVRIAVKLGNLSGRSGTGSLSVGDVNVPVKWTPTGGVAELTVPLGQDAELWDEFHPVLHQLQLNLSGESIAHDSLELSFGLRELKSEGTHFLINGRRIHFRGTHHGGDFPLTGFPPTDVEYWRKLFKRCREWGLNHMRFHSFCPPEAAFQAADEVGFYLQPECGMWNTINPGSPIEEMMYEETERMLRKYGNHPSFVLFSPSNEPGGRWKESLPRWVEYGRKHDPRHFYTTGTGWPLLDKPGSALGQVDYFAIHRFDRSHLMRGPVAWFGKDYGASMEGVDVPNIVHEVGQWCAYPNFDVISKYTGYQQPGNFEIFRDSAAKHGLLERNRILAHASGRFQLLSYKEEIEANLRTEKLAGFQLLDLHDYTGQGTALVGVLDPFWEPKSYVNAREWRRFCSSTVLLTRLSKRVFTNDETIEIPVEIAHYGSSVLNNARVTWSFRDPDGKKILEGNFPEKTISFGSAQSVGVISVDLSLFQVPTALTLVIGVNGTDIENDWNIWIYPSSLKETVSPLVLMTQSWQEAESALLAGKRVVFLPPSTLLDWSSPPLEEVPVFWNRLMNPGWSRMLGLWIDATHPALSEFPTSEHADWQWIELVKTARAVNLDGMPQQLTPIVQAIDDWNRNWKLGLLFEMRVGKGRLLVCSVDLIGSLEQRPVARQLRESILNYASSDAFNPQVEVRIEQLRNLWFDTRIMQHLGASIKASGGLTPEAAIDGDPNTIWRAGEVRFKRGKLPESVGSSVHPASLTVSFPESIDMDGVVLMPRQNDRNHLGDIREYRIEKSENGMDWTVVLEGELPSTYEPIKLKFPQRINTGYIRLTALSGFGRDRSVALAEIAVIYAGPPLFDGESVSIDYHRARSTSNDIEEN